MAVAVAGSVCAACGAVATHTAPLSSRWRRVHPSDNPASLRLQQVPDPPLCERHWEAFLHRVTVPIGWCVDCAVYGTLETLSPCGRNFESF